MKIVPKKKLYITLWLLLASLFFFMIYLVFQFLIGSNRLFSGIAITLTLISIIALYIKSVLNYFEVEIKENKIFIYQFGKLLDSTTIKSCNFITDNTKTGEKQYQRILFEVNNKKITLTNLEHSGYDAFQSFLIRKKLLTKAQ